MEALFTAFACGLRYGKVCVLMEYIQIVRESNKNKGLARLPCRTCGISVGSRCSGVYDSPISPRGPFVPFAPYVKNGGMTSEKGKILIFDSLF